MDVSSYRVPPGEAFDPAAWPTREGDDFAGGKKAARKALAELAGRLGELQARLYAEGKQALLIVLQGMDTAGKDGTIRHVFRAVNPQGVRVTSFKKPTALELAHDYLWRVHRHAPGRGEIGIFNRSHYEDVLVVRVHDLVPPAVWSRRYDHINAFEQLLTDEGTRIVKFFLHISKEEQKERLQARLDNPKKHWKFNPADLAERRHWDDYVAAYR
jgi:PPK2 family polyphosphate:nucleotide phosphotransferase